MRLRAHEADRPHLAALVTQDGQPARDAFLSPTANDLVATYQAAWKTAPCARVMEVPECPQLTVVALASDVDRAMKQLRTFLDGMRGRGPCASSLEYRRAADCKRLLREFELTPLRDLDMVRTGWASPVDTSGRLTEHASWAARSTAEWRAFVDYGVALAPVCAPRAAASCDRLREGLPDASPDELIGRLRALGAAYREGTPCPTSKPSTAEVGGPG